MMANKKTSHKESPKLASLMIPMIVLCLSTNIYGEKQYKKFAKEAISLVVDGQLDEAINGLENYLSQHPNDLESLYGLTVAYAQKNDIEKAFTYMKQAINILNLDRGGVERLLPIAGGIRDEIFDKDVEITKSILTDGIKRGIFCIS